MREEDICLVGQSLPEYNQQLLRITGKGLAGIAAYSLGKDPENFATACQSAAVIPIAYGQGIITGFSETVRDIISFLGVPAFVTKEGNLGGLAEAVACGAKIIFLADDDKFIAINLASGKVSDNGEATGRGYAAALNLMAGGVQGRKVLVIGAGPVGCGAATYLAALGAELFVHDCDTGKTDALSQLVPTIQVAAPDKVLNACNLIIEATPTQNTITKQYITADTCIAAPGIPLGIDQECRVLLADRLIHDVLEIGVATMLFSVLTD